MKKEIGSVIASKRREKGYSQIDIADKLALYDIHVKNAAVSSWEKNNNTPTAAQLLALCQILDITDIYTEFIGENKNDPFAGLNEDGIRKAMEYIELLKSSEQYCKKAEIIEFKPRIMKVALLPTSAGTGELLGEEYFEEVEINAPVPNCADFGVYLNGDSMEPQYKNEELVWFKKTEDLESGELGLFCLNGMTYFKKFVTKASGVFLVSLNAKYAPIEIKEFDNFRIFAKLAVD